MAAMKTVSVPDSAVAVIEKEEPRAVEGEVITPTDTLQQHERIIRRGWQVAQKKAAEVYESLTFIYRRDLWKLHTTGGKRKYKSFQTYLFGEFGWTMSAARAHQIIREYDKVLIEKGILDENEIPVPRARTAPIINAARCADVTTQQITNVIEAFGNRIDNTEDGPNKQRLVEVYTSLQDAVADTLQSLAEIAADDRKESETAEDTEETETEE